MSNSKGAAAPLHKPRHLVWLTIADVLNDLGIDRGSFDKWRKRGVGPRMKLLPNRTWRIRGDWYDAWLANLPGENSDYDGGAAVAA
ncbi:helix-turn-helix transcriptional regulator [Blastococcus aggregatus]|nr:helix-turn-helix domain-containing protein [Blastococcus aggregatus]